jgi:hypothetical protein
MLRYRLETAGQDGSWMRSAATVGGMADGAQTQGHRQAVDPTQTTPSPALRRPAPQDAAGAGPQQRIVLERIRKAAALAAEAAGAQSMRKAFENNVARRRPRLRRASAVEELAPGGPGVRGPAEPVALVSRRAAPPLPPPPPRLTSDAAGRRVWVEKVERQVGGLAAGPRVELEKIRRRPVQPAPLASSPPALSPPTSSPPASSPPASSPPASSPPASSPPASSPPPAPTRGPRDVLSRVEALAAELTRTHHRAEALRGELQAARGELARAPSQPSDATGRLAAAYAEYLLQVALRRRTVFAQAFGDDRPAAAELEAPGPRQPDRAAVTA